MERDRSNIIPSKEESEESFEPIHERIQRQFREVDRAFARALMGGEERMIAIIIGKYPQKTKDGVKE